MGDAGHVVLFMTAPNEREAEGIGKKVVSEGLAACCNILPGIKSIYVWKGELMSEEEVMCVLKTRKALFKDLMKRIKELHSYEVPEIISVDISEGLGEYLRWIDDVTARGAR